MGGFDLGFGAPAGGAAPQKVRFADHQVSSGSSSRFTGSGSSS